jgi:CRISPR-associated endonuclease/helicase Cas3
MLCAKKAPQIGTPCKTLLDHSTEVLAAAETMFCDGDNHSALGSAWLRFFRLDAQRWPQFRASLTASALLHDIGKANDGFQGAMSRGEEQILRHEHLSALILSLPAMRSWLATNPLIDVEAVLSAVACHHLKASRRPAKHVGYPPFAQRYIQRNLLEIEAPEEVAALLSTLAGHLDLPEPPSLPTLWSFDGSCGEDIDQARTQVTKLLSSIRVKDDLFIPALKAALIAADAAGSGLPRQGHDIHPWLESAFGLPCLTSQDIEESVLGPRKAEIEARRQVTHPGYRFAYQDFQEQAANLPSRALMLAPCGVGKTLSAWRWIAAQLDRRPARRAIFLYPTRATATEGFKDYVSHAPESATLLSGTAAYELQGMFDNPADPRSERSYETEARLFAIGVWEKRLFSATVDQFLGFMQQGYASLCALPVLVDSLVVFDEVHSFDAGLFSTLIRFLEEFDLPALCMTASLPSQRREALKSLGFSIYPDDPSAFRDLQARAEKPRYRVKRLSDQHAAREVAEQSLAQGKRVLWVVNSVDRCQSLTQHLSRHRPICYHSRFKLRDRNARHRDLIQSFAGEATGALLAITTQVCEMSLDLDADVLISETSPITALIQRMGRCNRHESAVRDLGFVYLYPPESERPYSKEALVAAERFIADLLALDAVDQSGLEALLEEHTRLDPRERDRLAAFLDDGGWARGGEEALREGEDFTLPAVLDTDLQSGRWKPGAIELVVPVPIWPEKLAEPDPRLPKHLRLAPSTHYSQSLGFTKSPMDESQGVAR